MKKWNISILNELYKKHFGNISAIAREVGISKQRMCIIYSKFGMKARGHQNKFLISIIKKNKLIDLLNRHSVNTISKKFNVSPFTLKKWCNYYNIITQKRDRLNNLVLSDNIIKNTYIENNLNATKTAKVLNRSVDTIRRRLRILKLLDVNRKHLFLLPKYNKDEFIEVYKKYNKDRDLICNKLKISEVTFYNYVKKYIKCNQEKGNIRR